MIEAETYLLHRLKGTRLSAVVHKFVVDILADYLEEGLNKQRKKHDSEIRKLNRHKARYRRKIVDKIIPNE